MSTQRTKRCLVCGKEYEACKSCNEHGGMNWRNVCCCREHFAYHIPIIAYYNKTMPLEIAYKQLISAIEQYGEIEFCDNIEGVVTEILSFKFESDKGDKLQSKCINSNDEGDTISIGKPKNKRKKTKQIEADLMIDSITNQLI